MLHAEFDVDLNPLKLQKAPKEQSYQQKSDRKMEFLAFYATHYPYQICAKNEKRILLMGLKFSYRIHLRSGRLHFVNKGQNHCTLVYIQYVVLLS
jgi:hypothetical protein